MEGGWKLGKRHLAFKESEKGEEEGEGIRERSNQFVFGENWITQIWGIRENQLGKDTPGGKCTDDFGVWMWRIAE
jgi:hypothetical protein